MRDATRAISSSVCLWLFFWLSLNCVGTSAAFGAIANEFRRPIDLATQMSQSLHVGRDDEIRVHLDSLRSISGTVSGVTITGEGLRFPGASVPQRAYQAIRVQMNRLGGGGWTNWIISDRDTGDILSHFKARSLSVTGRMLRMNLKSVPGRLTLFPSSLSSDVYAIASIDLETYVRGVLPSEMPPNWPLEALKAQAIAVRTFALYRKAQRQKINAPYDVETGVMDQVYMVPVFAEGVDQALSQVERAVRETKGMLLVTRTSVPEILASYYHADCGGRTEDAQTLWGQTSAGTAVDGSCPLNPQAHWHLEVGSSEIAKALADRLPLRPEIAEHASRLAIVDIKPIGHTTSGRVSRLKVLWSGGQSDSIAAHEFRMALGSDRVKSTNFKLSRLATQGYSFIGVGYGHGVGMCQWGAKNLAQNGRPFREILTHYYPKSALITVGQRVSQRGD